MNTGDSTRPECRLATIPNMAQLPQYCGAFTVSSLRHLAFEAKQRISSNGDVILGNGLEEAGAIIRVGRKLLIDLDRFDAWLDSHRTSNPSN